MSSYKYKNNYQYIHPDMGNAKYIEAIYPQDPINICLASE